MSYFRGSLIVIGGLAAFAFLEPSGMALAEQQGQGGDAPQGGGLLGLVFPLVLTFAIFYFLLIRPQQRQSKDRQAMLKSLKKGDEVVTSGGLHGKIMGLTETIVTLEVADLSGQRIRLKYDRDNIARQEKSTQG